MIAEKIVEAGIEKVKIRTVLNCKTNMVFVQNVMVETWLQVKQLI